MFCQTLHVGLMQVTHSISPSFVLSSIVIVKLCPKSFFLSKPKNKVCFAKLQLLEFLWFFFVKEVMFL